jgi:hypothetical protein
MQNEKVVLVQFGLGGHSIIFNRKGSSLSGYSNPENFFQENKEIIANNTPVIDKRSILEISPFLAFQSPLIDPTLQDNQIDKCPQPSEAMAFGLSGSFQTLLLLQEHHKMQSKEAGPLDSIGINDFINWWRSKGAKIGKVVNNSFVWEN